MLKINKRKNALHDNYRKTFYRNEVRNFLEKFLTIETKWSKQLEI